MMRAAFLDRDGVINAAFVRDGKPYPPTSLQTLEILAGVSESLSRLKAAGFRTIVVTNQPDVRLGRQRREVVEAMNAYLAARLQIDDVKVCYHIDGDGCACRKPRPGMLLQAAEEFGLDLKTSFLVGDRWRDIAAAHAAGCPAYFIDNGYTEKQPLLPYVRVKSLQDAVNTVLGDFKRGRP